MLLFVFYEPWFRKCLFVVCVWGCDKADPRSVVWSGMTSRPSDEGEFFSCAYWNQFSKNKTSGIANCIKTNWRQFLDFKAAYKNRAVCCRPDFAWLSVRRYLCSESAVWEIHWSSVGLHTGPLFCPERPPQRDLRWVNGAFSGLQILLNIILLFIKNVSWFLLMVSSHKLHTVLCTSGVVQGP